MACLLIDAAWPHGEPMLDWPQHHPGYAIFVIGALATVVWVHVLEDRRRWAAEHPDETPLSEPT